MRKRAHRCTRTAALVSAGLLLCLPAAHAEDDAWLEGFDEVDTSAVNEGSLTFLADPPADPVHSHHNRIRLTTRSLRDGWAQLYQCHTNLDPVPDAQVVFRAGRIRQLQVEKAAGIGVARVEGHSVQLEDVTRGAELCISAESRVVVPRADGGFLVRNGPFMRRFLDGYYPMHVILEVELPPGNWSLADSKPLPQPGFTVQYTDDTLTADAWFAGELQTKFYFMPAERR